MKCKLDCFLDINSELAIVETDYSKIKLLVEKSFEVTIPEENPTLHSYSLIIHKEIEHCKNEFYKKMYDLDCQKEKKDHVNAKHTKLDSLKDHILDKIGEHERYKIFNFKSDVTGRSLYQLIYVCLDQFQCSIEKRYWTYLNLENHLSTDNLLSTTHDSSDIVQSIICHLSDNNINRDLISIVMYPSQCMMKDNEGLRFKVRDLMYYKKFVGVFNGLVEEKKETITDRDIVFTLFYLNFNSVKFYDFATKYIRRAVSVANSLGEKYTVLSNFSKETKCNQVCSLPFTDERDWINKLLYDFCKAELKYFEVAENIEAELHHLEEYPGGHEDIQEDEKLWMNLSVDTLSCLVKSMKNIGLIQNENLAQTYRIVAKHVRTIRKSNISDQSLLKKSYDISDKSRKELIAYIELLLIDLRNQK